MTRTLAGQGLAVVGAGVMGVGIATLAVGSGIPVTLVDRDGRRLERARQDVAQQLRLAQMMGALSRDAEPAALVTAAGIEAVAGASAVVEAVTELPELKAKVLAEVCAVVPPGTLLVSNTSAIPIDEQAGHLPRPQDLAGAHFMNPPYLIRTVEVIRGPRTSDAAMTALRALLAALGRDGVEVGDGPGFVVNRILQWNLNQAALIVQEGVATPESVDRLFPGCLGHRTGPLATADLIGLDNVVDSLRVLHERTADDGYRPCDLLLEKVARGDLGRKTGRGFFDYPESAEVL